MDYLSRIGIFIEVARQESFAAAARELGITSSAVSKQIQNLEYELKAKLLNRTTRRVSLTEEGALFFERARRALEDIQEAKDQLDELKASPKGTLRISVPMALGISHLKKPISAFALRYPDVHLDVSFDDRIINIAEENFDVVIRVGLLQDSTMIARKLAVAPIHVCASPVYIEKRGRPQTPEDLAAHNVFAYTRNKGAHEWRYKAAGDEGAEGLVSLNSTLRADNADMMIEAAVQGLGIVISPCFFVADELASGRLVRLLDGYRTWPERNLYAIFPPNRYLSTRLRLFVDHIDAYCGETFRQE
ncbi:MAG: LysR substrate-binding domain-containing protein [Alphaproteobacteria bacterium]|nr:LysR substrate-binding domain-containing protein [Alphaproteobacteria bacterium]